MTCSPHRATSRPAPLPLLAALLLGSCGPLPAGTGRAPVVQGPGGPATPDPAIGTATGPNGVNGGMGGGGGVTAGGGVAVP